ncbi:MAG: glutamate--tRNA ligase [Firmicutes bacterium HGW-Firmicutes-15]|nr:MAG: glutamate--tRNA ligase [Firmicutes bacterium HGW-Firmicutes-15]
MKKCKVRFAPSPTGPLHIGGARSALFNYLFASHQNGEMVMRIEDTDLERSRREYEDEIIESLQWLGIKWGEGVAQGGENGPYRQTERLEIYRQYVQELLDKGMAYYCFCTQEELEMERQEQLANGNMQRYSGKCSDLSDQEIEERIEAGIKPSIRFRVPQNQIYVVDDLVRGRVSFESDNSGDFIIAKSDGIPVYNFAVVIDDVLMGISHVIRAEEHLSNTPRQIMLYEALNFARPEFAHISLILGSDRQKMSKRHGATSLVQYREMGYLPEALFNFLALLGWSPQGEEEILSPEEIIKGFTLDRVAKSPAVFDLDKLNWVNQQYLKKKSNGELAEMLKPYLSESEYADDIKRLNDFQYGLLVEAVRDHLVCLSDVTRHMDVFFREAVYEEEALRALEEEGVMTVLQGFRDELPQFSEPVEAKEFIKAMVKKLKLKPKNVYMPLRSALSGQTHGPELPFLILIWGREECLRRIDNAIARIR